MNPQSDVKAKASAKASAKPTATAKSKAANPVEPTTKATGKASASVQTRAEKARTIFARLREIHPDAHCELDHRSAFELLVATVLSAQTTDKLVNKVTPKLFASYPDARALSSATPEVAGTLLREGGLGMFNQKGKNIVGLAKMLVEHHGGEVPRTLDALVALPGVGRKTANVVMGVMWGAPDGVVVDTHVSRLSQRLGFTQETKPETIEKDLCKLFPREDWDPLSHTLIFHGRRVCFAIKPACSACGVSELCPSAFQADQVGRKTQRGVASQVDEPASAKPEPANKAAAKKPMAKKLDAKKASSKASSSKPTPTKAKPASRAAR